MRKPALLLVPLLLTALLLPGCGDQATPTATPAAEQAVSASAPQSTAPAAPAVTQAAETPAPTALPARPEEAAPYLAQGRFFSLALPAEWEGQISVEERDSGEPYYLRFFHSPCHEGGGGHLFSLHLYPDTKFVSLPNYRLVGMLSDGQSEQFVVMLLPTDVQARLEYFDAYYAIYDEDRFLDICRDLLPAEGYAFGEADPAVLRAAQVRYAYANRMSILLGLNKMPDNSEAVPQDWGGDMANNRFAVFDVDGDGEEELLVSIEDGYMAARRTMIYGLSENRGITAELGIFPSAEYYEQGFVKAYASHNHTHGTLWPYTLYRYDAAQGIYLELASVYGWDKQTAATDFGGEPFPDSADRDGSGSVVSLSDAEGQRWIDEGELAAWEAEQLAGAAQLTVPWQAITRANVDVLLASY